MLLHIVIFTSALLSISETLFTDEQIKLWWHDMKSKLADAQLDTCDPSWAVMINYTDDNARVFQEVASQLAELKANVSKMALHFLQLESPGSPYSPEMRRILKVFILNNVAFPDLNNNTHEGLQNEMASIVGQIEYDCPFPQPDASVCSTDWRSNETLRNISLNMTTYERLTNLWINHRSTLGQFVKPVYEQYVELVNAGARGLGFKDAGHLWRSNYLDDDDDRFQRDLDRAWLDILPFYEHMYAYIRRSMRLLYPGEIKSDAIPIHIMEFDRMERIADRTLPFPGNLDLDLGQKMKDLNFTVKTLYELAEQMYQSLGFEPLPQVIYDRSRLTGTNANQTRCGAYTYGCARKDFQRILMCANIDMNSLQTLNHEMGHVYGWRLSENLDVSFQGDPNDGTGEAMADMASVSMGSPSYWKSLGLIRDVSEEQEINFLYKSAIEHIFFELPLTLVTDLWRWAVLNGSVPITQWNNVLWNLLYRYAGHISPSERSDEDFDAGMYNGISQEIQGVKYYLRRVLLYHLYEALCKTANKQEPFLHRCNLYGNKAAGTKMMNARKRGHFIQWYDTLEAITGQRQMSGKPMVNYYKLLMTWLEKENDGDCFGWGYEYPDHIMESLPQPRCGVKVKKQCETQRAFCMVDNRIVKCMYVYQHSPTLKTLLEQATEGPSNWCLRDRDGCDTAYILVDALSVTNDDLRLIPKVKTLRLDGGFMGQKISSNISHDALSHLTNSLETLHIFRFRLSEQFLLSIPTSTSTIKFAQCSADKFLFGQLNKLVHLSIRDSDLRSVSELNLSNAPILKVLDLYLTRISTLRTQDMRGLINLEELTLSCSGLSVIEPGAFADLIKLKQLSLTGNAISSLPSDLFQTMASLEQIDFNGNPMAEIRSYFSGRQVVVNDGQPCVERNVADCEARVCFRRGAPDKRRGSIAPCVVSGVTVQCELALGLRLGDFLPQSVSFNYTDCTNIADVNMTLQIYSYLYVSADKIEIANDDFISVPQLQKLTLSDRELGQYSMSRIESNALANLNHLKVLNISGFSLSEQFFLSLPSNITRIFISDCFLRNDSFSTDNSITHLTITRSKLTSISLLNLSSLANTLTHLDLAENMISTIGAEDLSGLRKLQFLRLKCNGMSKIERDAFKDLVSLYLLDLRGNSLPTLPCNLFDTTTGLRKIYFMGNPFSDISEHTRLFDDRLKIFDGATCMTDNAKLSDYCKNVVCPVAM